VDEAAAEVTAMQTYFNDLSAIVNKQLFQLKALNETETELALFLQQRGCVFLPFHHSSLFLFFPPLDVLY
jgi:hypothetical protein